jgi:eIF-2B alpha/beta/delta-like uncharacterized protein
MKMTFDELRKNFLGSYIHSINALYVLQEMVDSNKMSDPEKFAQDFNKMGRELIKWQPNQVAIRNRVTTVVYYLKRLIKANKSVDEIKIHTTEKINELIDDARKKQKQIAQIGSKLILNHNKVLTIGYSSNVKEILLAAKKQRRKFEVFCLESRPSFEGRILAEELVNAGVSSHIITDASMGRFMQEVNLVVTGADRIYENAFVNKIGTLPLALTAQKFQIPFYVAVETYKILHEVENAVRFYPQKSDEVYKAKKSSLQVSNYHFESIPLEYVSKVVNEEGIYDTVEFSNWYLEE